jgi:hypothetical protein
VSKDSRISKREHINLAVTRAMLTTGNCLTVLTRPAVAASDVWWKIFQKIFRFLKSSLNISFFNLFLVALGLGGFESCMCSYLTVAVYCQ